MAVEKSGNSLACQDSYGSSALLCACDNGRAEVVQETGLAVRFGWYPEVNCNDTR